MSRSLLCARSTCRLLSVPSSAASSLRPSSYSLLRTTCNSIRQGSSTTQNPSQKSFSDRGLVIGLLALTTLLGFGIGTRAKSIEPQLAQNSPSKESNPTLETHPGEGTGEANANNENNQTGEASGNESEQAGAFNPETGEINWDCPCLGGMAHGSCGEQFKAAFSCFVYSQQEPKGVECIEKFKLMQDCFKDHPDEYGPELADNDDPTNEEKGDLPPDPSEGEEISALETKTQPGGEDRELMPNQPSSPSNQNDEPASLSQVAPSHEISLNSSESTLLKPIDDKSSPL